MSLKGIRKSDGTAEYIYADDTLSEENAPGEAKATGDRIGGVEGRVTTLETAAPEIISTATKDWLDDNVTPTGSAVAIDSSLTQSGLAADAKAAGDAVNDLKSDLNEVEELTLTTVASANNWNPATATEGYLIGSYGNLVENSNIIVSDFIEIPSSAVQVKACSSYNDKPANFTFVFGRIGFYDSSKNFISPRIGTQSSPVPIPSGAKYVRVDFIIAYTQKYIGFENGTGVPSYVPYSGTKVNTALKALSEYVPSISQDELTFAEPIYPINLLDVNAENDYKEGYWYYSTSVGSTISAQSNQYTSLYTAIRAKTFDAEKITIGVDTNRINNQTLYWVGGVDKDMKLLGYTIVNSSTPYTYTLPEGTVYVLASVSLSDASLFDAFKNAVMISSGETLPAAYAEYSDPYYVLKGCKAEVGSGTAEATAELFVPDSYDLVVGDTFQLFYKGILKAVNLDSFMVRAVCNSGSNYTDLYEYTPETAGMKTLALSLFDANHKKIAEKSVSLVAHAVPSSPASNKNVLCVGDSLTTGGEWVTELKRRLTGSGGTPSGNNLSNITFIGTKEKNGAHFEGYGGWTFQSFNTANVSANAKIITCTHDKTEAGDQHSIYKDSNNATWKLETIESGSIKILLMSGSSTNFQATGTLIWVSGGTNHNDIVYTASENAPGNPFWDDNANKVDFSTYATSLGITSIDFVYVMLGWNSVSVAQDTYKAQVQTFIDNVKASFPNVKIVLMGLEIPARDGLGVNYGAKGVYSDYYTLVEYVKNLDKLYAEIAADNTNVYSINISGQFDTAHNMMTQTRQWNTRNSGTYLMQSNGVHPAESGYLQIADAVYRHFVGLLGQ